MIDRELLEMAAKAINLPERGWMGPAFMYVKDNIFTDWNPLTDDSDALRLAVKLGFQLTIGRVGIAVRKLGHDDIEEQPGDDPYAATRRAIVRAAAEIGKAMP